MKQEVRSTKEIEAADPKIQTVSERRSISSLAEEVKARQKPTAADPISVAQKLAPPEFNTAMVHFYRGEIQRSNVWRTRLDTTTNWAVITTGATLSFVFSSPDSPHFAIPINTILVAIFLFMEARRYRYYEVWANRVRVLETGYFAPMLSHQMIPPDKEWAEHIAADLLTPHFTITDWESVGRRLRSNYIWMFLLLGMCWTLKVYLHPFPIPFDSPTKTALQFLLERTAVGLAPGWLVLGVGALFNVSMIALAVVTRRLKDSKSEVLPFDKVEWHPLRNMSNTFRRNTIRRVKKARQRVRSVRSHDEVEL
jgi:uncharacterized membrane protein